jgi:hypothetical protein
LQSTRPKSKMKLIAYSDDIKQSEVIININQ